MSALCDLCEADLRTSAVIRTLLVRKRGPSPALPFTRTTAILIYTCQCQLRTRGPCCSCPFVVVPSLSSLERLPARPTPTPPVSRDGAALLEQRRRHYLCSFNVITHGQRSAHRVPAPPYTSPLARSLARFSLTVPIPATSTPTHNVHSRRVAILGQHIRAASQSQHASWPPALPSSSRCICRSMHCPDNMGLHEDALLVLHVLERSQLVRQAHCAEVAHALRRRAALLPVLQSGLQ